MVSGTYGIHFLMVVFFRYLLPLLFQYDSTAEETDKSEAHGVGVSVQVAKNMHAVRTALALARLSGLGADENQTPYNMVAADALRALLTPKLASMLKDQSPKDLLFKLNSNLETPEVIAADLLNSLGGYTVAYAKPSFFLNSFVSMIKGNTFKWFGMPLFYCYFSVV